MLLGNRLADAGLGNAGASFETLADSVELRAGSRAHAVEKLVELVKRVLRDSARGGLVSFKLNLAAYARIALAVHDDSPEFAYFDLRLLIPNLNYVLVTRDPLDRALSFASAWRTGLWLPLEGPDDHRTVAWAGKEEMLPHLNKALLEDYLMKLFLADIGGAAATINYADIVSPSSAVLETVAEAARLRLPCDLGGSRWVPSYESDASLAQARLAFSEALQADGVVPRLSA